MARGPGVSRSIGRGRFVSRADCTRDAEQAEARRVQDEDRTFESLEGGRGDQSDETRAACDG